VLIAPIGIYTAVAKHPTLNFCTSISDTVEVTDGKVYPQVTATQKAALTYCDPANPNGVAYATVNGSIIGYNFDWYEGALTNPSIYTGSEASALKATTYFVKATDVISGCPGTTSITIESDPLATPIPQITVISDRTDCTTLDGALSADVGGVTGGYIFNWYDGATIKNQADATGEIYADLDAGTYTVTATDRITGCTSNGVQEDIEEKMEYPVFEIKTVATACDANNGTAEVNVSGNVEVIEVQWDIQGAIEFGPQISNLPAGTFTVTAISTKNCNSSESFEVKTDIAIYNAVSKNNDGLNDVFEIGCIDDFPNNSVKIFNRAGTLVYEAGGYNNADVSFNGISNRGINIMGNDLPDGTYFYIVNKGDGSEPRTGYLELLH
jgi:gliding motility-associated-like protein